MPHLQKARQYLEETFIDENAVERKAEAVLRGIQKTKRL